MSFVFFVVIALAIIDARPNRYGRSDREERHLLPAVSSGPLDPAWSPDGKWIAFSMRGDIWKIPAAGGEAIQLTKGPAYHFEPAWSPDGGRIAFSFEVPFPGGGPGNLRIGTVPADEHAGRIEERVIDAPGVNIQPAWSRDGKSLFFTSARAGGFRIFRHDLATGEDTELVVGIQPAPSPDGTRLAYEQSGLHAFDLDTHESNMIRKDQIRDEETEYRMEPSWTPDGQSLVYVTEDGGSNDIRLISAVAGGDPVELTTDRAHHEMSPAVSPDGTRVAFVQFVGGVPTLYTMPIAGGRSSAWTKVPIVRLNTVSATGRVRIRVVDEKGQVTPARVYVTASDGRHYTPEGLFHRSMMVFDRHYFHMDGTAEVELPVGPATIEAIHGWEHTPARVALDVTPRTTATNLALSRVIDLPARGWYSGDSHVHDLHQGFGLTHEAFFRQLAAEDLNITHALIHMDGTRIMGRWEDLTGAPSPLSTSTHILQYAEEFRGGLGHIGMIGLKEFVLPFTTASGGNTPYGQISLDTPYLEGARAQGGLAGFMHPYTSAPRTPQAAAATLIGLDVALGLGDYYDIGALYSDERGSADFYYRLLNAGFHLPATGGTDNFSDVWLDPPPGSDRTFAHLAGPLTMGNWMAAVKKGRTFFSNGPLLLLTVDGHEPGDEISLALSAPSAMKVKAVMTSIAPIDSVEILVNGEVVQTVKAIDPKQVAWDGTVNVPDGGWVAARASGPKSIYLGDDYAFVQTSPVYVVRGGKKHIKASDVQFLADTMDAIWTRAERTRWRSDAEKAAFKAAVDKAKAYYLGLK